MIIVMEGTNSSGKTSFAKFLKENLTNEVIHLNDRTLLALSDGLNREAVAYGFNHAAIEMAKEIETANPNAIILFDRFHFSEDIYGKYCRGYESRYTDKIDEELHDANAVGLCFFSKTSEKRSGKKQHKKEFYELIEKSKISWLVICLDYCDGKMDIEKMKEIIEVADYARQ